MANNGKINFRKKSIFQDHKDHFFNRIMICLHNIIPLVILLSIIPLVFYKSIKAIIYTRKLI